jgi:uncharacterized protein
MEAPDYASPCIRVCALDPDTQLCVGCFRTLDEIAGWTQFSNAERAAIRQALDERRVRVETPRERIPAGRPERCGKCGAGFLCGASNVAESCWCVSYPSVAPTGSNCLCPACLAQASR